MYFHRFTLTPQRMRMIVEAFKDTLELGLSKFGQVVVSTLVIAPTARI
jgi:hexokinase